MTTHITYKTAKALKEFLGESTPFPMRREVWVIVDGKPQVNWVTALGAELYGENKIPAYELHDLLSKPFCEAMEKATHNIEFHLAEGIGYRLWQEYYNGGLPAVESALCKMIGEER